MGDAKKEGGGGQTQESQPPPPPTQTGPRISDNQASSSTKTLQGKRPCPGQTMATEASTRVQGALEASSPAERSGQPSAPRPGSCKSQACRGHQAAPGLPFARRANASGCCKLQDARSTFQTPKAPLCSSCEIAGKERRDLQGEAGGADPTPWTSAPLKRSAPPRTRVSPLRSTWKLTLRVAPARTSADRKRYVKRLRTKATEQETETTWLLMAKHCFASLPWC